MNIPPTSGFPDFLRQKVESGEYPSVDAVLEEAMRRFQQADEAKSGTEDRVDLHDPIDHDAIVYCAREIDGREIPSIEEVRRILSSVRGSLADTVAEEREDRF